MGINGSHKLLTYWLTDVTMKELFSISKMRCESAIKVGIERSNKPTIDVDVSWIYRRSSCAGKDALEHTFSICLELVKAGFHVKLICDGSTRHYTKRATIARQVKRYKSQLNIFEKRTELMQLSERKRGTDSLKERECYEADEKILSNSINRMENQFQAESVDVGQCLYNDLKDAIALLSDDMIGPSDGFMSCCQAKYQADSIIAYRAFHGISDVVLMNDSDLAAHVGNNCFGIKDFKFIETAAGNSLSEMVLFSPSYDALSKVAQEIGVDIDKTKHRIRRPEYPVFENINDIKLRCLMAVGLGCDVTANKNTKGVTARSLWLFLKSLDPNLKVENIYYLIMNFFIMKRFNIKSTPTIRTKAMNNFVDTMEVYLETFMYEPATYYEGDDNLQATRNHIYIHGTTPLSLHPYVKDFAENNPQIKIRENSSTMIGDCVGAGNGCHCYLKDDSSTICNTCTRNVCSLCIFKNNDLIYCVDCYVSEKQFSSLENIENTISIASMRQQLHDIGLDVGISDSVSDIVDWYDALIVKKCNLVYANNIIDDCTIPTENSVYMRDMIVLYEFDVKEGGRFIRNDQLTIGYKFQLLSLLSDLVTISDTKDNTELDAAEKQCYAVMPKMLVHFAKNARIGSGYRLIKRCIRHGLDPMAISILHANVKVIQYKDEIGLFINHKIRASMKTDVYELQVTFTRTVIVSCTCSCKAGCFGKEKVICVHILPTIFQYTLLLFDGLSEHVLCELANDWTVSLEKTLSLHERNSMIESLHKLEQATGKASNDKSKLSIHEFLKRYQVGTESRKMEPPPPKDPSKLGPLRELDFRSPTVIAKNIICKYNSPIATDIVGNSNMELDPPEYTTIRKALDFLTLLVPNTDPNHSSEHFVGYRLLALRDNNEKGLHNTIRDETLLLHVKEAIKLADSVIRYGNKNKSVEEILPPTVAEYEMIDNNTNVRMIYPELEEAYEAKGKSHTGACAITNCLHTCNKLVRVPPIQKQKQFTASTSIGVMKTHYKKQFLREEWLRRIYLDAMDERKDLRICNTHTLQKASFSIPWKNKEGIWETFDEFLVVPMMDHESVSKTRTEITKRALYFRNNNYDNKRTKYRTSDNNSVKSHRKCDFIKCTTKAKPDDCSLFFRRVPPVLKLRQCKNMKHINAHRKREAIRKFYRNEFLRRIGLSPTNKTKDLRICSNHPMEYLSKSIDWVDKNNNKKTETVNFPVPAALGLLSHLYAGETTIRSPKGVGIARQTSNYMNNALEISQQPGNHDLSWGIAFAHSLQSDEDRMQPVDTNDPNKPNNRRPLYFSRTNNTKKEASERTVVRLSEITDNDVCKETGYRTKQSLLSTIIILCNGDIKKMCKSVSRLTWFEEWYFVLEKIWGKSNKRYFDVEKKYKRSGVTLRQVFDDKIKTILEAIDAAGQST